MSREDVLAKSDQGVEGEVTVGLFISCKGKTILSAGSLVFQGDEFGPQYWFGISRIIKGWNDIKA